ncbi:MAG: prohibitin family protein [Prosthecochloris sp.]|uniref:Band 7 protein n=1 Tax=Prosthecochloris aestuarii (strain DSM 271 / SK 413) TaxID=290512 RepID=B4S450_PROA2|nr:MULTISPECIES: prohibitin family protein [Prosthecochloris]ACF46842.1 band 7 protein [Prosthecochloris aestuarii DSM 271]MCW8798015.1 prohibitin family protein [Prosthecochloris sp.]RDD29615.1 band 7 protein [Prosthecochloris sp. ZM]
MSSLLFLGIILLFIGFTTKTLNPGLLRFSSLFKIGGILAIILALLTASIRIIEPGKVGVKVLFGEVKENILASGLNIINPLIKVEMFDITTQTYTMSGTETELTQLSDAPIRVLSADGLEVTIDMTVLYRINPTKAPDIRREIGPGLSYIDKIVRPTARTRIRDNAVIYNAIDLYSTKREEFQTKIFESIELDFKNRGLILENLLVRNISLPSSVKAAIEAKINAEQDAQKMQFVLQKERQEAERKRVEATGISDYQQILTRSLTDRLLEYERIKALQNLVKSENAKVIIMGDTKGASVLIGK